MRPLAAKKPETSLPLSAMLAILSAETGFTGLRVSFLQFDLLPGRFPKCHQMMDFTGLVVANFANH